MQTFSGQFIKIVCLTALLFAITACGQKGKLYLPSIPPAPSVLDQQGPLPETSQGNVETETETETESDEQVQ